MHVRPAKASDHEAIARFAADTFDWGDYVADAFPRWLDDPHGRVFVAVDEADEAVGVSRVGLVSEVEAWIQGTRVAQSHRRSGIATDLAAATIGWARDQGAHIARLAVEDWNEPAHRNVLSLGFRPLSEWIFATRSVGDASPVTEGNGGKRVASAERLKPASRSEAEAAFMAWEGGDLAPAARRLFSVHWIWRRLTLDDLEAAARAGALWEARTGWALAAVDRGRFDVAWLQTDPDTAYEFVRALVDRAIESGADSLALYAPATDWLVSAARRAGCKVTVMTVYGQGL